MAALGVNGPDDVVHEWDAINWRLHEDNVRRLRQRIFMAVKDGEWPKVRNLQKLLLRSWSNTLVSVRQASQRNTVDHPGFDGGRVIRRKIAACGLVEA
jgi:RNA-directed DNA polymerase